MFLLPLALAGVATIAFAAPPVRLAAKGAGEGPVWRNGWLYFSGDGAINRWRPGGAGVEVFRSPSGGANGLAFDVQGRLIVCEGAARRVTRTEANGSITVLAESFEGRRFNSPNDLSIDTQGRIYFSDPRYGRRVGMEMDVEGVYRIDAPGQVARVLGREVERANGVQATPDGKHLYVADNNNNNPGGARKLWRFDLRPDGSAVPASRKLIYDWKDSRGPDGVKMGARGRLYVAAGLNLPHPPHETAFHKGGIYILTPEGRLEEFVPIPKDEVTNCAFGGTDGKTLFVTAGGSLWSLATK